MTAYFMQELILEPYAGIVFKYTPSQTTSLSGMQNGWRIYWYAHRWYTRNRAQN